MDFAIALAIALQSTDYSTGPYTATIYYSPSASRECEQWLGKPPPGKVIIGCYVPMIDTIIESWRCDPKRRPEAWCAEHHEHELRHARGERHLPRALRP